MSEEMMRGPKPMRERHKRPDKQVYVPRAIRGSSTKTSVAQDKCESDICKSSSSSVSRVLDKTKDNGGKVGDSNANVKKSEITAETTDISISKEGPENEKVDAIIHDSDCITTSKDTVSSDSDASSSKNTVLFDEKVQDLSLGKPEDSKSAQLTKPSSNSETSSNPDLVLLKKHDESTKLNDGDSWESMFDDDGECLNPKVIKQLEAAVSSVDIKSSEKNYSESQPISGKSSEENECIVELHSFPKEFITQDLVSALSFFPQSSYTLKWVDDCHALALFSSPAMANQALLLNSTFVKIRPLIEGIKESKEKARYLAKVEPMKPRPATSAALARRLVSGALGLRVQATREQREKERNLLKEAKEKRKLLAKQRQDIWDGQV